jgi:hypothetical protein
LAGFAALVALVHYDWRRMVLDVGVKRMERRTPGPAHVHSECNHIIISLLTRHCRNRFQTDHPVILRPAFFAGRRTSVLACSGSTAGTRTGPSFGSPRLRRGLRCLRMTRDGGKACTLKSTTRARQVYFSRQSTPSKVDISSTT